VEVTQCQLDAYHEHEQMRPRLELACPGGFENFEHLVQRKRHSMIGTDFVAPVGWKTIYRALEPETRRPSDGGHTPSGRIPHSRGLADTEAGKP